MKRFIPILFAVFALAACEKEPDTDKLDNEYLVYTNYDKDCDFSNFQTYYVPDSILYINSNDKKEYWQSEAAQVVLSEYIKNMDERFLRVDNIADADLGLQLSYVANTYTFTDFVGDPWWSGYPYYWSPGYWGGYWGGLYYPFPIVYSYSTGSIIGELVDLSVPEGKTLNVVWNSYISGLLYNNGRLNLEKAQNAIDQAFRQSTYLNSIK